MVHFFSLFFRLIAFLFIFEEFNFNHFNIMFLGHHSWQRLQRQPDRPIRLLHVATLLNLLFKYNKVTSKHQ